MNQENGHFIFHLRISFECLWACLLNHTLATSTMLSHRFVCENNHEMIESDEGSEREYGDRAVNALCAKCCFVIETNDADGGCCWCCCCI